MQHVTTLHKERRATNEGRTVALLGYMAHRCDSVGSQRGMVVVVVVIILITVTISQTYNAWNITKSLVEEYLECEWNAMSHYTHFVTIHHEWAICMLSAPLDIEVRLLCGVVDNNKRCRGVAADREFYHHHGSRILYQRHITHKILAAFAPQNWLCYSPVAQNYLQIT